MSDLTTQPGSVGVVVIGRNEGAPGRCLRSVVGGGNSVAYVDSGSSDQSVALARELGVDVVELDMSIPFTAARARNEGLAQLVKTNPQLELVQFVDGDCEIVPGWIEAAREEMSAKPQAAVVCGRCRERFPDASIFNAICDIEWDTPIGEADFCGGIAMMRAKALNQVEGFNPTLIAGEEPELCFRLRHRGWKIYRVDSEMTLHDAAMTRFRQWWKRSVRAGHAYAQLCAMHADESGRRYFGREVRSNWFWGMILPIVALGLAWPTHGWSLLLLVGYLLVAVRMYARLKRSMAATRDARPRPIAAYTLFTVLGKFPQAVGQMKYLLDRRRGRTSRVIEYKGPSAEITKGQVA